VVAIIGAAAWSGWAQLTQRVVTDWLEARADEGWYVNYDSRWT
jgi:hypothetical protein